MNIWILVIILGFILTIAGFVSFLRRHPEKSIVPNSTFLLGIFMPMLVALMYAETLITDFFPNLTLLDLAAFYFIGMISGFFVALYLRQSKFLLSNKE